MKEKPKICIGTLYWIRQSREQVDEALKLAHFNCEEGSTLWALASEVAYLRAANPSKDALDERDVKMGLEGENDALDWVLMGSGLSDEVIKQIIVKKKRIAAALRTPGQPATPEKS